MKIKSFLLLSLIITTVSLSALPMDGDVEEEKSGEQQQLLRQREEQEARGDTTGGQGSQGASIIERGDSSGGFTEPKTNDSSSSSSTPSQIDYIRKQIVQAVASGDGLNHPGWARAVIARVKLEKKSVAILNPPAPSWISSWWSSPAAPTEEERAVATANKIQCLALEAALPAWKQNALAVAAKRKFDEAAAKPSVAAEPSCWDFWKKTPAVQEAPSNPYGDVIEKWEHTAAAWKSAQTGFAKQMPQDLSKLPANEQMLWKNAFDELEQNKTLAGVTADGWYSDQNLEGALIFYKEEGEHNPNVFERVMRERNDLHDFFKKSEEDAPEAYKAQWHIHLKQMEMNAALWNYKFYREAGNNKNAAVCLTQVRDAYKELIPPDSLEKIQNAATESRSAQMSLLEKQERHWSEKLTQFNDEIELLLRDQTGLPSVSQQDHLRAAAIEGALGTQVDDGDTTKGETADTVINKVNSSTPSAAEFAATYSTWNNRSRFMNTPIPNTTAILGGNLSSSVVAGAATAAQQEVNASPMRPTGNDADAANAITPGDKIQMVNLRK